MSSKILIVQVYSYIEVSRMSPNWDLECSRAAFRRALKTSF